MENHGFLLNKKTAKQVNKSYYENLADDILKIIVCQKQFKESNFGPWGKQIKNEVLNWVENNNVDNVEFYLDKDTISSTYGDPKGVESYTQLKINWLSDYYQLQKKKRTVFYSSNVNVSSRSETQYNGEWFFTGSDATHYVLIHKI